MYFYLGGGALGSIFLRLALVEFSTYMIYGIAVSVILENVDGGGIVVAIIGNGIIPVCTLAPISFFCAG